MKKYNMTWVPLGTFPGLSRIVEEQDKDGEYHKVSDVEALEKGYVDLVTQNKDWENLARHNGKKLIGANIKVEALEKENKRLKRNLNYACQVIERQVKLEPVVKEEIIKHLKEGINENTNTN